MKNFITKLLLLSWAVSFAGCGTEIGNGDKAPNQATREDSNISNPDITSEPSSGVNNGVDSNRAILAAVLASCNGLVTKDPVLNFEVGMLELDYTLGRYVLIRKGQVIGYGKYLDGSSDLTTYDENGFVVFGETSCEAEAPVTTAGITTHVTTVKVNPTESVVLTWKTNSNEAVVAITVGYESTAKPELNQEWKFE